MRELTRIVGELIDDSSVADQDVPEFSTMATQISESQSAVQPNDEQKSKLL